MRLGELGESGILERILPGFAPGERVRVGVGDDAAVVEPRGQVVATTDAMVEGFDFLLSVSSPLQVGHKAAVQNLADVAAMGARPLWLLVTYLAPQDLEAEVLEGISAGLAQAAQECGAAVIGGDLGSAHELTISVTALGVLDPHERAVQRSGARAGDVVVLGAPRLGMSAAGLALVLDDQRGRVLDNIDGARELLEWHCAPRPALHLGWGPGRRASAMIDVSDGLVRDAARIARASRVSLEIDSRALAPDCAHLAPLARHYGVDPLEWVLTSGEEHAMLATFPRAVWEENPQVRDAFREIGRLKPRGADPVTVDGSPASGGGWDHFETRE